MKHQTKKFWPLLMLASLFILFSLLLSACGSSEPTSAPAEQATAAPADQSTSAPADQATAAPAAGDTQSAPAAPAAGVVDTGFRPNVNGFSLPNYGDVVVGNDGTQAPAVNLTPVEMRRMFGDGVCAGPVTGDTCTLTPPADQWMQQNNASMKGGHCEGFAVLSQLIYAGIVDPNKFGGATAAALNIQGNEALQRELAYWWTTQGPTWNTQQILAPVDAIKYLQDQYAKDPKNLFRIGIMKPDKTGGHAITAYEVQDKGDGTAWIMVYDNNYPGQERHITVDLKANTWQYEASINPSVQPDLYTGDTNNPILIAANQPRLQQFPCPFCTQTTSQADPKGSDVLVSAKKQAAGYNEIWTEGYVNIELVDDKGRKLGYDDKGNFVNEIKEANLTPVLAGPLSEVPPVFDMPEGLGFTASIYGDTKAADEPSSVVMIGKGFYLGVDNINMTPGQTDQLAFDGGGDFITYTTDSQESPDIIAGITKPGADFELDLKAVKASKGTDIHVLFDQKNDTFAFQTTSDAPADFTISITRTGTDGKEETFDTGDTPLTIDSGKLMYFYFGKWQGQGSDLEVGYDANGDGTIQDSEITNMKDAK